MRIVIVSQWFQPEGVLKGLPFAKELVRRGHEVQVLTGFPNYPEGKIYPPYELSWRMRERLDGIDVIRVPLYPNHDRSAVRRMLNYTSFTASASTIGALSIKPADVAYVYHPPATVAWPAMELRWLRGIPYVCDIQDLWPDVLAATGMFNSAAGRAVVGAWCQAFYKVASHIVVLSPGFKRALVARGVPDDKISVIYNWTDDDCLRRSPRDESLASELGLAGRFNVIFAGNLGMAQALDSVIEAAARIAAARPEIQFVFVGDGAEAARLRRLAKERSPSNTLFLPARPAREMPPLLALGDVLLVHLKSDPAFDITVPSKIQAYLASGRPIVASVRGDAADLVMRAGAGLVRPPEDSAGLAEAVIALSSMSKADRDRMGENGRCFYERELALEVGAARFVDIFEKVRRPIRAERGSVGRLVGAGLRLLGR